MLKILPRPTGSGAGTGKQPAAAIPNAATAGGRFLLGRAGGLPAPRAARRTAEEDEPPCAAWWPAS